MDDCSSLDRGSLENRTRIDLSTSLRNTSRRNPNLLIEGIPTGSSWNKKLDILLQGLRLTLGPSRRGAAAATTGSTTSNFNPLVKFY